MIHISKRQVNCYFQKTPQDKARRLLDILPSRGPRAFSLFMESLRDEYDWLAETLEEADPSLVIDDEGDEVDVRLKKTEFANQCPKWSHCRFSPAFP